MQSRRVDVLGVGVDPVTEEDVLELVWRRVEQRSPAQIVTVNAEYVMLARKDEEFAALLARAEFATPDGAGVVWAMRRKGATIRERVGGADLIWSMCERAAALGQRVFFLGGSPGVAAETAARLQHAFPGLVVAGTCSGSPERSEEASIVDLIRRSKADIIFVAFGAPRQDVWVARNLRRTGAAIGIGVGGSFDYIAGTARRAPVWMRKRGLEWLWRLIRQPRRWRRMLALPRFVWMVCTSELTLGSRERMRK